VRGDDELEQSVADLDPVAVLQDLAVDDQRAVDERAVRRAKILDDGAVTVDLKLEVLARHLAVVEHEAGTRVAADDDRAGDLEECAGIGSLDD